MRWKIVAAAVFLALQLITPAYAGSNAQSPRTTSVSTGSWAAVAYGQGLTPTNSPYTITWTVSSGKARDFFSFRNTGNYILAGFSATVSQSQTSNNGKLPNTSFDWCQNGVWNASTNSCSGSIVSMGVASDVTLTINFSSLNLGVGSELSMRATTQPNLQYSYTSTISVFVPRSQIRSGIVTNS